MAEAPDTPVGPRLAPSVETVQARLADIWRRIEAAGGSRETVTVVGVTKTFGVDYVRSAVSAGLIDLGENYAQELVAKDEQAAAIGVRPRWHFIGGLQRNKVKLLAGRVSLWQTVDRPVLLDEIAKRSPGSRVLIQVNTTGEEQKSGCHPADTSAMVEHGRRIGLDVEGLMTVGPTGGADPRPSFEELRALGAACGVRELSMGMSADFALAVEAGATIVRIGSAIFGPREPVR